MWRLYGSAYAVLHLHSSLYTDATLACRTAVAAAVLVFNASAARHIPAYMAGNQKLVTVDDNVRRDVL
jgi:hypothetical protein